MSLGCCSSTNIWYIHPDWLGSSRVVSGVLVSGSWGVVYDRSFSPFGDVYQSTGYNDALLFAGLNSDLFANSGTGSILYDSPNRELANNASRWLSPDPAGLAAVDPTNPQSWNRYAYVAGNPLSVSDPTGLFGEPGSGYSGDQGWNGCNSVFCSGDFPFAGGMNCWDHPSCVAGPAGQTPGLRSNGLFPGQDCVGCWSLGPSPMDIVQQVLSGNFTGALQDVGILPNYAPGWILDANNGPDPVAVANSMKQYVKAQISNCYNGFHQTTGGKVVQSFSALALFPVASNAGDNRLALGAEILGKFSAVAGSNSAGGLFTAFLEGFTANVTTPAFILGTGADAGAYLLCAAGGATSIHP